MNPQKIARVTGLLFVTTFVTGIPAALLYDPVLDPGYIARSGADNRVFLGASLELLLIIANIGTAVVLFPILRRQSEAWLSAMSRLVSLNVPSSLSALSASFRS